MNGPAAEAQLINQTLTRETQHVDTGGFQRGAVVFRMSSQHRNPNAIRAYQAAEIWTNTCVLQNSLVIGQLSHSLLQQRPFITSIH